LSLVDKHAFIELAVSLYAPILCAKELKHIENQVVVVTDALALLIAYVRRESGTQLFVFDPSRALKREPLLD